MNGRKASLPGLPAVTESNLLPVVRALAERSEVREGGRGDAMETAVTMRDIADLKAATTFLNDPNKPVKPGDAVVDLGGGLTATIAIEKFVDAIKSSKLFKDLNYRLDNPERFATLPVEVRRLVEGSIAEEAARLGASITRVENKAQSALTSLATVVDQVTAAVDDAAAGVRQVSYAYAQADAAQAGEITQVQARLNGTRIDVAAINQTVYPSLWALYAGVTQPQPGAYYQIAGAPRTMWAYDFGAKVFTPRGTINEDGSGTTTVAATLEKTMAASVDRITGAEAKYTVKINAGGSIAGFGLLAADNNGKTESAFIVQAEKFAIVGPSYNTGLTNTPNLATVPFGVDASGIYMNTSVYLKGNMRIDSTAGKTLQSGLRGSVQLSGANPAWDDNIARQVVYQTIGRAGDQSNDWLVIGDMVTLTNSATNASDTRQWLGASWVVPGAVINGNLLVDGTVAATKINTNGLVIRNNLGQPILTSGISEGVDAGLLLNPSALNSKVRPTSLTIGGASVDTERVLTNLRTYGIGEIDTFIARGAIGSALIGDAAVGTLKIGKNAVTIPFFKSTGEVSGGASCTTSYYELEEGALLIAIATARTRNIGTFYGSEVTVRLLGPNGLNVYLGGGGASFENFAMLVGQGAYLITTKGFYAVTASVSGGMTHSSVSVSAFGGQK